MPRAETHIHIDAPPEQVWHTLSDAASWHLWNPAQPWLRCRIEPDARGWIAIRLGGLVLGAPIRLVDVEPARALYWEGGLRGLFYARHGFSLSAAGDGTEVRHVEEFSGMLSGVIWRLFRSMLLPAYAETNEGLRQHVEQHGRADL